MAEGYLRSYMGDWAAVSSAGIETHGVNPRAIKVMAEDGIDISGHSSDLISKYDGQSFDYVITVCDNAHEQCPYFPASTEMLHHNFPDPAKATGSKEEILDAFRSTRDLIRAYTKKFAERIEHSTNHA